MARGKEWTVQEVEDIERLKLIKRLSLKEIAEALGRSYDSVSQKAFEIKFNTREYSEQNIEYLNKLIFKSKLEIKSIARKLGRTEGALKKRIQYLFGSTSLTKIRNDNFYPKKYENYTESEKEFLKENYYEKGGFYCAKKLERTIYSVRNQIQKLKREKAILKEQTIPRFNESVAGYVIYSNETGKIIERYETLEDWHNKKGADRN